MSPNVASCDPSFQRNLIAKSTKAVGIAWSADQNELIEKAAELEKDGIPVFVLDLDSCTGLGEEFKMKPGDAVLFQDGQEVSRIVPSGDPTTDVAQIKQLAGK
jgi:hypothetical protein